MVQLNCKKNAVLEGSDLRASMFGLIEGEMEFVGSECPAKEHCIVVHSDGLDCDSSGTGGRWPRGQGPSIQGVSRYGRTGRFRYEGIRHRMEI